MLKLYRKAIVVLCAATFVGVFVGAAAAENVYLYDFDSNVGQTLIVDQKLTGQDGWYAAPHDDSEDIYVRAGHVNFSGNYAEWEYVDDTQTVLYRDNDSNWSYSLVDGQDFELSGIFKTNTAEDIVNRAGLTYEAAGGGDASRDWMLVGTARASGLKWEVREFDGSSGHNELLVETLALPVTDEDTVYKIGMEATAKGGNTYDFQLYYQDIAGGGNKTYYNGGEVFTVTFRENLSSMYDMLYVRTANYDPPFSSAIVDEIRLSQVPEPSTLALLGCGLIGLLAYAWRKRK